MRKGATRTGVLVLISLASAWLAASGPRRAAAEEPPQALDEREMRARLSKLRSAAGRYITHRKRFPSRCPVCHGSGQRVVLRNGRPVASDCAQCDGQGSWVSRKDYRAVYYDMRTPAFRALPDIRRVLGQQYDLARHGRPWPTRIRRYRLRDRELADPTHGIVWFLYDAAQVPTATYWIWAAGDGAGRFEWHLYDARSDGPWPSGEEDAGPLAPRADAALTWQALDARQGRALRAALAQARLTFRPLESVCRGSVLRVRLRPWADPKGRAPAERVGADAVRLARAVLAGDTTWDRVEAEWRVRWRDVHGRIALKPAWVSILTRAVHGAVLWETRALEDQIGLLTWQDMPHEGWVCLDGERPMVASLSAGDPGSGIPPPPPTPLPPPGPLPTPSGVPTHPRPPDELPAPGPSTDPVTEALPTPSPGAVRTAHKGLERMRALFAQATHAHDEGVLAHQGGAHDLWQEKLSEARAFLAEIEEAWVEEVVAPMPGVDLGVRDAVANEQFGEIWDDVYKLKAMVRKMSALR